jgi:polyhydroxyalkanoate synthesis regulator phasin
MAEVCENVNSISFQLLNEGKLTENEAKALASKNILANVQSVLTEIKRKFNESQVTDNSQSEELLLELASSIDEELKEILSQLSSYYPQAPPVGASVRMKEVIADVNRT